MSISRLSCSPALTKPGVSNEPSCPALAIASLPAIFSDRLAHQNIRGHLSFSPTASGVMPADFELAHVGEELVPRGGRTADPRLVEERLVVPDRHEPEVVGDPVLLAVDLVEADARLVERVDPRRGRCVMSWTSPASACSRRVPPPPGLEDVR